MPKPARHVIVHQPIKRTGTPPYNKPPNPYRQHLEANAQVILGPALRAYRALSGEMLITVVETKKVILLNRTVEKKVALGEFVRSRLGNDDGVAAAFVFSLVVDSVSLEGDYLDLAIYDSPGARIYRQDLDRIARAYASGQTR